jgi:hypothetical protein
VNRVAYILAALVLWAVSSGLLFFMCVFSVNQTIISAALIVSGATFIGSGLAFATKHNRLGVAVAAGPAVAIAGILAMFVVVYFKQYR